MNDKVLIVTLVVALALTSINHTCSTLSRLPTTNYVVQDPLLHRAAYGHEAGLLRASLNSQDWLSMPMSHSDSRLEQVSYYSYGQVGDYRSYDVTCYKGSLYIVGRGGDKGAIFRLDYDGLEWIRFYGSPNTTFTNVLFYNDTAYIFGYSNARTGSYEVALLRVDVETGAPIGSITYFSGLPGDYYPRDVVQDDSFFYIVGVWQNVGEGAFLALLNKTSLTPNFYQFAVGPGGIVFTGVAVERDAIYVVGYNYSSPSSSTPLLMRFTVFNGVYRMDWEAYFREIPASRVVPARGLLLMRGRLFFGGYALIGSQQVPFIAEYTRSGVHVNTYLFPPLGSLNPARIVRGGGYIYVVGTNLTASPHTIFIAKVNGTSGLLWTETVSGTYDEWGSGICFDSGIIGVAGHQVAGAVQRLQGFMYLHRITLREFPSYITSSTAVIVGDSSEHGPYSFGARTPDVLGAVGVASALRTEVEQFLDVQLSVDGLTLNWSLVNSFNVISVGGPGVNTVTFYYNGTCPFIWSYKPGSMPSRIYSTLSHRYYSSGRSCDYALIQLHYDETFHRNVVLVWGLTRRGTLAACYMLQHHWRFADMLGGRAFIVKWEDSNGNRIVDLEDSFTIVEKWP